MSVLYTAPAVTLQSPTMATRTSDISTNPGDYRHRQTYRVRYDDLDTYRHVNNKSFLTYIEDARVYYLMDAAGFRHHHDQQHGVMVVHAAIDYLSQIHPFEEVTVYTRCARIGTKSITLHHLLQVERPATASGIDRSAEAAPASTGQRSDTAPRPAAVSTTIFAAVDMQSGRSTPVSQEMIDHINGWEYTPPERAPGGA
ncbi:MAG: acyl-CoA thioesterase [Alkalispirochaeta sp.]